MDLDERIAEFKDIGTTVPFVELVQFADDLIAERERLKKALYLATEALIPCNCIETSDDGTNYYPAREALARIEELEAKG